MQQQRLFLALKRPHKPITSATVSRWLKEVIRLAGVKEEIFKGHSVRGASTSAAKRAGLSIDTIMSMADWTNSATFNKFYYKPAFPILFGTTVLACS
jgi:arginine repressor